MPGEYLIFNLLVLAGPLGLSFWHRTKFVHLWPLAFLAVALPGVPYLVWDALVTGRHWEFNEAFSLPVRWRGHARLPHGRRRGAGRVDWPRRRRGGARKVLAPHGALGLNN